MNWPIGDVRVTRVVQMVTLAPLQGWRPTFPNARYLFGATELAHWQQAEDPMAITGDVAHSPVQLAEPDWVGLADTDQAQACRTRHGFRDVSGGPPPPRAQRQGRPS